MLKPKRASLEHPSNWHLIGCGRTSLDELAMEELILDASFCKFLVAGGWTTEASTRSMVVSTTLESAKKDKNC
jgi:hypothetical protein